MASAGYWMGFTRDILAALAIALGAFVSYFLLCRLTQRFRLRVEPRWSGETLILRLEVENTSPVRAGQPDVDLQILRYALAEGSSLSEWVPFLKKKIRQGRG